MDNVKGIKVFVARVTVDGEQIEKAFDNMRQATDYLNHVAVREKFEDSVIDSMSIVRFSAEKVFKPDVMLNLIFPDPE